MEKWTNIVRIRIKCVGFVDCQCMFILRNPKITKLKCSFAYSTCVGLAGLYFFTLTTGNCGLGFPVSIKINVYSKIAIIVLRIEIASIFLYFHFIIIIFGCLNFKRKCMFFNGWIEVKWNVYISNCNIIFPFGQNKK